MPLNQNCLPPASKDQGHSGYKNLEIHDTEYLCDELNVDDAALNFESCVEMFGSLQGHSKYNFEDGRRDCQVLPFFPDFMRGLFNPDSIFTLQQGTHLQLHSHQPAAYIQYHAYVLYELFSNKEPHFIHATMDFITGYSVRVG